MNNSGPILPTTPVKTGQHSRYDDRVSAIRALAMIFIVTCHFMQYYKSELTWWFNVGVQIFFIISGFLYGQKTVNNWLKWIFRNFQKILLPYYTYLAIMIVFYYFFARNSLIIERVLGTLLGANTIPGLGHLWFIAYILVCYLLTPYYSWLWERYKHNALAYIIFIALLTCVCFFYDSYFKAAWLACYFVGYLLGKIKQEGEEKAADAAIPFEARSCFRKIAVIITILCIIANTIQICIDYFDILAFQGAAAQWYLIFRNYAHLLLGAAIFLLLYLLLPATSAATGAAPSTEYTAAAENTAIGAAKPGTLTTVYYKFLRWSDRYSYEVYIVHHVYILGPFCLMSLLPGKILPICLTSLVIVLSAVLLKYVIGLVSKLGRALLPQPKTQDCSRQI